MNTEMYKLKGKTAIVTGGGKGLGKVISRYLLEAGMRVSICGRDALRIESAVAEMQADYPDCVAGMACDVGNSDDVAAFVAFSRKQFGDIHVLVNNSGFGKETRVWETSEADWDAVMDTNVKGAFLMCKAVVPGMIDLREGFVLNIASQAALNGYAKAGVYCASKFAMVGLGKALQEEVRDYGIHVHSLNPALIQSHKTGEEALDSGRLQNEDLAAMAVFLLQQPRRIKFDNIGLWAF